MESCKCPVRYNPDCFCGMEWLRPLTSRGSEAGMTQEQKITRRTELLASAAHNLRLLGVEVEVTIKQTVVTNL